MRFLSVLAVVLGTTFCSANAQDAKPKTRTFLFTYGAAINDLAPGKVAEVWLPMPETTPEQEVRIVTKQLPAEEQVQRDKTYGNKILYLRAKADDKGSIALQITYEVTRREVRTDRSGKLFVKPAAKEPIARFLQPDVMVPIKGKPLSLIEDKELPEDQFATAKMLYDLVNTHMEYKKVGEGWGRGDAVWACDNKFGNCSDFHSLFISLARARKIPSKFEMGFPLPAKRGEGTIGGYHCWAWFLPDGNGWVPVDISEANRNPEMREYYFGNLTEDRVQFSTGRDIELVPKNKSFVAALNYFIYPHVEVDGQTYPGEKVVRTFTFKDL